MEFVNTPGLTRPLAPQAVVLLDAASGLPAAGPLTNTQLRAAAVPIAAQVRVCLGTQMLTGLSATTAASLTVPGGAVVAEIQADGGTVRMRRDGDVGLPTATRGWRLDDGVSVTVDSVLANVRLLAQSGTTTNVQITYFDKV